MEVLLWNLLGIPADCGNDVVNELSFGFVPPHELVPVSWASHFLAPAYVQKVCPDTNFIFLPGGHGICLFPVPFPAVTSLRLQYFPDCSRPHLDQIFSGNNAICFFPWFLAGHAPLHDMPERSRAFPEGARLPTSTRSSQTFCLWHGSCVARQER